MSKEVWSEIRWELGDIMAQYGVSEDKAGEIASEIGNYFEERLIELGWEVMDSLVHSSNLLDDEEEGEDDE
jgi:hypothetical protein